MVTGENWKPSLALKSDGTLWAWGDNSNDQKGCGTTSSGPFTPIQLKSLSGVCAIAAAGSHSLAVESDGTVWAWGTNLKASLVMGRPKTAMFRSRRISAEF